MAILWAVVDNAVNAQMLFSEALVDNETRPRLGQGQNQPKPSAAWQLAFPPSMLVAVVRIL